MAFGIDYSKYLGTTKFPIPAGRMEAQDAYGVQPGAPGNPVGANAIETQGSGAGQFVGNMAAGTPGGYAATLAPGYGRAAATMGAAFGDYDPTSLRNNRPPFGQIDNTIEDPTPIPDVDPRELMGQAEQDISSIEREIPDFMPTFNKVKEERMARLNDDLAALGVNADRQKANIAGLRAGPMPSFGTPGTAMGDLSNAQQMMFQKAYDFAANNVDTQRAGAEVQLRATMNKTLDDVLGTVAERYFDGNVQQALDHPKLVLQAMDQYATVMGKNQEIALGQNQIIGQNRRQTSELNNRDNALQYTETGQDARQSQLLAHQMATQNVDFMGRAILQDTEGQEQHNQFNAGLSTHASEFMANSQNLMETAAVLAKNGQQDLAQQAQYDAYLERVKAQYQQFHDTGQWNNQLAVAGIQAAGGSNGTGNTPASVQLAEYKAAQQQDANFQKGIGLIGAKVDASGNKLMTTGVPLTPALQALFQNGRNMPDNTDGNQLLANPQATLMAGVGALLANPESYTQTDLDKLVNDLAYAAAQPKTTQKVWGHDKEGNWGLIKETSAPAPSQKTVDGFVKSYGDYVNVLLGNGLNPERQEALQGAVIDSLYQGMTGMNAEQYDQAIKGLSTGGALPSAQGTVEEYQRTKAALAQAAKAKKAAADRAYQARLKGPVGRQPGFTETAPRVPGFLGGSTAGIDINTWGKR